VERALEIIGEATGHLTDEVKDRESDLPWREMRGLRNIVAHAYHRVDAARVWQVVTDDLPGTHERIRALRKRVQAEESQEEEDR
jgi:uncharacterized protein with HEPN domain